MTGNITHFFAGGNTARGFTNLYDSSLQELEKLYVLQGGANAGRTSIIRTIAGQLAEEGHEIWLIHCASDHDLLDGFTAPELKLGIIDGTAPRVIEPKLALSALQTVDLGELSDSSQLDVQQAVIDKLKSKIIQAYELAYTGFAEALRIHDEWEKIYIANMDFRAADNLTKEYEQLLYNDQKLRKKSRVDHRFLGAATPVGAVDFVPNLTEGLKRYLIKGRPGSGKSTMLKKLASAGIEKGFDVEIYHCGFDPNSLDMVIVRELKFAIFDSTAPHEYDPEHPADEIVDMYARCITPGTDEKYSDAIERFKTRYSAAMKQSTEHLAQAKSLHDELEQIYVTATDFSIVERIKGEILAGIQFPLHHK